MSITPSRRPRVLTSATAYVFSVFIYDTVICEVYIAYKTLVTWESQRKFKYLEERLLHRRFVLYNCHTNGTVIEPRPLIWASDRHCLLTHFCYPYLASVSSVTSFWMRLVMVSFKKCRFPIQLP